MRLATAFIGLALASAGAGPAQAAPDARNPFHCAFALSVAYERAKEQQGADSPVSRELKERYIWLAMRSAMLPHMSPSTADREALRTVFDSDPQASVAMADNCVARQNADPRYIASRPTVTLPSGLEGALPGDVDHAALALAFGTSTEAPKE